MPSKKGSNIQSSMSRGTDVNYSFVDGFKPQNGQGHVTNLNTNSKDRKNIEKTSTGSGFAGPITRNL